MTYECVGLFEVVENLRAPQTAALPRPTMELAPINPSEEQFLAVDETAGITHE